MVEKKSWQGLLANCGCLLLHGQHVVATARGDLLGNGRLTAHDIDRDDGTFERQRRQQFFDRGDRLLDFASHVRWPSVSPYPQRRPDT